MAPKSAAQKKAQKTYIGKFSRIEIRVTPEERIDILSHATAAGQSNQQYILQAVLERMEREKAGD